MGQPPDKFERFFVHLERSPRDPDFCVVSFYLQPSDPAKRSPPGKAPRVPRSVVVIVRLGEDPSIDEYSETYTPVPGFTRRDYEARAIELVREKHCDHHSRNTRRPPGKARADEKQLKFPRG